LFLALVFGLVIPTRAQGQICWRLAEINARVENPGEFNGEDSITYSWNYLDHEYKVLVSWKQKNGDRMPPESFCAGDKIEYLIEVKNEIPSFHELKIVAANIVPQNIEETFSDISVAWGIGSDIHTAKEYEVLLDVDDPPYDRSEPTLVFTALGGIQTEDAWRTWNIDYSYVYDD